MTSLVLVLYCPLPNFLVDSRRMVSSRIFLSFSLFSDYSSRNSSSRPSLISRSFLSSPYRFSIYRLSPKAASMFLKFFSNRLLYISFVYWLILSVYWLIFLNSSGPEISLTSRHSLWFVLWFSDSPVAGVSRFYIGFLDLAYSSAIFLNRASSFSYAIRCLKAILLLTSIINFLCITSLLLADYILFVAFLIWSTTCITRPLNRYRRTLL